MGTTQIIDSIPVVINNRDRLTTTRNMVEQLLRINPKEKIIIIDNGSTYPPLWKWYHYIKDFVTIMYEPNHGHLAFWSCGLYKTIGDYFVYTDSDIVLNEYFPDDWKHIMYNLHKKYNYDKIALGLRIDDLPIHYRYRNQVKRNEGRWWLNRVEEDLYEADTDTTFCFMRNFNDNCYKSLRITRKDMICRHAPWYHDLDNLNEEEKYYLNHLGERVTTQYSKQHKNKEEYNDI
jgi:glycosyltransferase involved in cell wall biosynthesis